MLEPTQADKEKAAEEYHGGTLHRTPFSYEPALRSLCRLSAGGMVTGEGNQPSSSLIRAANSVAENGFDRKGMFGGGLKSW